MDHATAPGTGPDSSMHQTQSQAVQSARSGPGPPEWQSFLLASDTPPHPAHRCRICSRTYERADHLNRHLKSHENARPHQCRQCLKSFNRVDLLNRHVATHARLASESGKPIIRRTERTGQACIACAAAKARCGDHKPCRRCQTKNIPCETATQSAQYSQVHLSSPRRESLDSGSYGDDLPDPTKESDGVHIELGQSKPLSLPGISDPHGSRLPENARNGQVEPESRLADPLLKPNQAYPFDTLPMNMSEPNLDFMTEEMLFFPNPSDFNNQDLDFGFLDFNFDDVQLDFATPKTPSGGKDANFRPTNKAPKSVTRDASRGHAAFTRSPWLWTPAHKDCILNDQENLAIDEENIATTLTPESSISFPGIQSDDFPSIDSHLRDRMFYLVFTINKFTQRVPDFPSLDILNHVIRAFFIRQSYQVDNWIHLPTLSFKDVHPEFLLALVTAGSTVISVPAIWKMGLVLQDVVRVAVGDMCERKNSNTRALQPLQAFMLNLDSGLWCGFQRQMEIAESFGQPLITMMRRGGILAPPLDTSVLIPEVSDDGQILEVKWRKWSQRESFKRLAIHLFLHDTRASVALQKGALISFTELTFSLPAPRALFLATSAVEWKSKYLDRRNPSWIAPPRLIDAMHDTTILDDLRDDCDVSLCYTAILHGFWGQIWAYVESRKFHLVGHKPDSAHQLWLTTQHRELSRDVENFKQSLLNGTKQMPDLIMTVELFLMILHVSPEELQRFAGKAGEEAATQAVASLEQWASTAQARKAVWHAGQVFRSAAQMPPAGLRDFLAVAVYFASLTLWTYGHLRQPSSRNESERPQASRKSNISEDTTSIAIVDGPETRETRAFLSGHLDAPALTSVEALRTNFPTPNDDNSGIIVRLTDPNAALKIARDLYRSNFPVMNGPLPPLVENMGNLMRDLSSLPDSRFSRCATPTER